MGQPKAWLPFGDTTMLQHVAQTLSECCDPVLVVASLDQSLPALPQSVVVVRDGIAGLGPLGGLHAAFHAMPADVESFYLSGCDTPFITSPWITAMRGFLTAPFDIALPRTDGIRHTLHAVLRCGIEAHLDAVLQSNQNHPASFFARCRIREVSECELVEAGCDLHALININTPEEYAGAQTLNTTSASRFPAASGS